MITTSQKIIDRLRQIPIATHLNFFHDDISDEKNGIRILGVSTAAKPIMFPFRLTITGIGKIRERVTWAEPSAV
jgi:hypothetical protein